ncbi:hypothetical protein B0H10DRAFT_2240146 [Mycena sp. CBHHK59/15]|nr:hypothetical protein B0H10DRAFT_2240146 [Mycena sp. CBHHK59/15]
MASPHNVIITGAARCIGHTIAMHLIADGCNIVVNDLPTSQDALDVLVAQIAVAGGKVVMSTPNPTDMTVEGNVQVLVEMCVETYGSLEVMVCNAGTAWVKPIVECTLADVEGLFETNFCSVWLGYKCAAKQMIKQGKGGCIIGSVSAAAKKGYPFMSVYSATKFAVCGLTQAAAQEWGPHKITVNTYCPGVIMTPLVEILGRSLAVAVGMVDIDPGDMVVGKALCCGTNGETVTDDIIGFISFLVSEEGGFITGQSVFVDGTLFD